jgi:hypothetical protein
MILPTKQKTRDPPACLRKRKEYPDIEAPARYPDKKTKLKSIIIT